MFLFFTNILLNAFPNPVNLKSCNKFQFEFVGTWYLYTFRSLGESVIYRLPESTTHCTNGGYVARMGRS